MIIDYLTFMLVGIGAFSLTFGPLIVASNYFDQYPWVLGFSILWMAVSIPAIGFVLSGHLDGRYP